VGTLDQTMPALFAPAGGAADLLPIAQLGAGPDGTSILARKGEQLVEVIEPSFHPGSPRWDEVEDRLRAIAAVQHPAVRGVLSIERQPRQILLEGDSAPPLAELVEQPECDLTRVMNLLGELARAIAAAHHVGIAHGRLHPWTVHVGAGDHPRIELARLAVRSEKHEWIDRCRAPEVNAGGEPDAAADVFAIGALLEIFATTFGRSATSGVKSLIADACAPDPDARPSASELVRRFVGAGTLVARTSSRDIEVTRPSRPQLGLKLGRFELVKQLGVGAMGEVWEAHDSTGGDAVAIKLLKPEVAADDELLRRFRKEARVLTKVGSPYIANIIDLNEDRGLHYLVLELCAGGSVAAALRRQTKLPERLALSVIADACRALAEPHRLGVVHRDIKPDNMMFVRAGIELESSPIGQLVKLGDFGIARLVEKAGEGAPQGATREGSVLGTPEFMAPEQCQGVGVTAATDVYALGCALFALIAGRPPFIVKDDNQMQVILAHLREEPPRLDSIEPGTTPAVADLVSRCLAKDPKGRPQDAAELLGIIEQLCDGSTALVTAHPSPPIVNEKVVQTYTFEWDLQSSPEALWPFVSNTEKMNRATGLAPVQFEIEETGTTGTQRVAGLQLKWREHPYEWIEGSRHTVLRVFEKGVLRWYVAEVTMERTAGGGTKLRNSVRMEPRGLLARVLSKWEMGVKYRRKLDRVYTRLDTVLAAGPRPEIDPIAPENVIPAGARERVEEAGERLRAAGVDADATEALVKYLLHASDQDVARIRPLELAKKFGVHEDAMIDACLHAAHAGVLAMLWDVICPSCRIPSTVVDSLKKIEEHGNCKTCNLGFDLDFSRAIELAFRASATVRAVETRTFCIGGPAHFPHVAAQVRMQPGERFALPLAMGPGFYIVRSPQLARAHELRVTASGGVRRVDITLGERNDLPAVTAGDQLLTLINIADREVLVRVERAGDRAYALTAARAMACTTFRDLFPDQSLAPGRLMAVTQATLVVAQLENAQALFRELGDAKAFPVASKFFDRIAQLAKEFGGTLVKTFGGLAIAAFERPGPALDVALALGKSGDHVKIAVHRGPMMALTQGGRLDYFGQNVETALQLASAIPSGVVGVTQAVCSDVGVAERLQALDRVGIQPTAAGGWVLHVRPQ
jgi:serine/threonine protein kinase/class 3 adenylate cyclase